MAPKEIDDTYPKVSQREEIQAPGTEQREDQQVSFLSR